MATTYGWVRNPLSVIAIFAGIAEVCAAVVLPILDGEAQHRFMNFVMFFPCALVGIFFFVLWFKSRVLYAPADYQTDESWLKAQGLAVYGDSSPSTPTSWTGPTPPTNPGGADSEQDEAKRQGTASAADNPEKEAGQGEVEEAKLKVPTLFKASPRSYERAWQNGLENFVSDLALRNFASTIGGNVTAPAIISTPTRPYFVDGVVTSHGLIFAVEVIYNPLMMADKTIFSALEKLNELWEATSEEDRPKLSCILYAVAENENTLASTNNKVEKLLRGRLRGPFIRIEYGSLDALMEDSLNE